MSPDAWHLRPGHSMTGPGAYDAGHGVSYTPYYADEQCAQITGLLMWHPCPARRRNLYLPEDDDGIAGWGPNARTGPAWGYENVDDPEHITLIGSVLTPECGWHGFIRNGRWEPC